jgi:hypothetical protein
MTPMIPDHRLTVNIKSYYMSFRSQGIPPGKIDTGSPEA